MMPSQRSGKPGGSARSHGRVLCPRVAERVGERVSRGELLPTPNSTENTDAFQKTVMLTGLALLLAASGASSASARQSTSSKKCPIDTTVDKDTGKPRTGVQVCSEGEGSGSVGATVSGKELEHFLEYPFGQSDHSVPKDIEAGVRHLGGEIGKKFWLVTFARCIQ
jgi:hypothetical protein